MKVLKQFVFLFIIYIVSDALTRLLHLPIPTIITSMLFMMILLMSGVVKEKQVDQASTILLQIMPMLFIPAGVEILEHQQLLLDNGLAFMAVLFITTFIVFIVTWLIVAAMTKGKNMEIISQPIFIVALSCCAYFAGMWIQQKTRSMLANPLLIAIVLIIGFLLVSGLPLDTYLNGTQTIKMLLGPATMSLGYNVYRQRHIMQQYAMPILVGTMTGGLVSIISVIITCKLLGLDEAIMLSLVPKSVTTPIAMSVSEMLHGIAPLSVIAVIITGIIGSVFGPMMFKLLKSENKIANGCAMGTSAHALGSARCMEIGETEGAVASISLIVNGIFTVVVVLIYLMIA